MRRERDPLRILATRLEPEVRALVEDEEGRAIRLAYQQALADPFPA
jgi:hypothetical protein